MIDTPYQVSRRLVVSGDYLEYYAFSSPFWVGFPRLQPQKKHVKIVMPKVQHELRADNVRRTRKQIRRLVNSNTDLHKFVTLTYAENCQDVSKAYRDFDVFLKRLKRSYPQLDLKFICVPEFQKRGAVHFHLLANLPYIPKAELEALWGFGWVRINQVRHITNLGAYISKYLGKANFDARLFRKKKFTRSQNLREPLTVDNLEADDYLSFFVSKDLHLIYESEFDTKWLGTILYKQFVLYAQKEKIFNIKKTL